MNSKIPLPPSRAERWVPCPASAQLEHGAAATDAVKAGQGTNLHEVLAEWLTMAAMLGPDVEMPEAGVLQEDERDAVAQCYVDVIERLGPDQLFNIVAEQSLPMFYDAEQEGKPDCVAVLHGIGRVIVWDFKFGHSAVYAEDNWQGVAYLEALVDQLSINGGTDQHWQFELRIVQPNCYQRPEVVDVWTGNFSALRSLRNMMQAAAFEARGGNPRMVTGKHCRYCSYLPQCRAARQAAINAIHLSQRINTQTLSDEDQAAALPMLKEGLGYLSSLVDAIDDTLVTKIESGVQVPGWAIERSAGRRRWADEGMVITMLQMHGIDATVTKPAPISTVKVKAKAKGVDEAIVLEWTEVPAGKAKLVRDTSTKAAGAFRK